MVEFCSEYLSDYNFLVHMIPHHQVAVDMSKLLLKTTCTPYMIDMCRNIIRLQSYEIWLMTLIVNGHKVPDISTNKLNRVNTSIMTRWNPLLLLECYYPKESKDSNAKCEEHHFVMKHNKNKITDEEFLKHMIPHHQVAVNMSKRLLKHTNNPFLMEFSRKIIQGQQEEIWRMKGILNSGYKYESPIL